MNALTLPKLMFLFCIVLDAKVKIVWYDVVLSNTLVLLFWIFFSFNSSLLFHVTANFYIFNFQWRKFNFFDVKANIDGGKLAEAVKVRLFWTFG